MTPWSPTTLVRIDDVHDRQQASDRQSRFGAYLAQHPDHFHEWDQPDTPVTPEEFACAAWTIANSPIMSPGYVDVRDDLRAVRVEIDQDTGALVARVTLPLRHHALAGRLPYSWRDWQTYHRPLGDTEFPTLVPPHTNAPVAVLTTTEVTVTATGWKLHTPTATRGNALTDEAKRAVRLLTAQINEHAGPIVARLNGDITT
ncbi:hypothetical protein [Streptomyces hydrogenans]|uniref:hypothetical protein n=1 Tax=Streptomyces hydrogenans TaxID=1873719 RepID=UPI0038031447